MRGKSNVDSSISISMGRVKPGLHRLASSWQTVHTLMFKLTFYVYVFIIPK